jgi:hypothetical protein
MKNLNLIFQLRLLFVLILVICLSCKEKGQKEKSDTNSFYTIPLSEIIKNQREVKLSEFAVDVEIIQLENTKKALIGNINDIKLTKEYIFVKSSGIQPITQFTREGKYIGNIGAIGRGPGEYDFCRTFSINEKNELIYIQANALSKMLVYNLSGEYLKSIEYPAISRLKNVWSRDNFFVSFEEPMMGNEPYVFMEHNGQGDTLQTIPNYILWDNQGQFNPPQLMHLQVFYRFDNKLYMKGWYNDTVYSYNEKNRIVPEFFIDLKEHKLPNDLIYERKATRPLPIDACCVSVLEMNNYIFIPYAYLYDRYRKRFLKEEKGCVLYNKRTKKGVALKEDIQWGFVNDIIGGPDFNPVYTNDTLAVMPVSAYEMKQYLDSDKFKNQKVKFPEKKEQLSQLSEKIKEDDNHFLILVKLKK